MIRTRAHADTLRACRQWDHQEQVKAVYEQLVAAGVPVWMDISGGMAADIFDSMAEGVSCWSGTFD